jgi:hypothetical protein
LIISKLWLRKAPTEARVLITGPNGLEKN